MELLLRYGASLEAADALGQTALMKAAKHGHSKTVALLLNWGADPRVKVVACGEPTLPLVF